MIRHLLIDITKKTLGPLGPLFSHMRPGNIAMFHLGRSGSTVLGQLLHQHPRIHWASELYVPIFLKWQHENSTEETIGAMPEDAISYLKKDMIKAFHRFYGFEIKPFHFRLMGYPQESYLDHLDSLGFNQYIILDRKNRLRKIISSLIAHQKGAQGHIRRGVDAKLSKIHININDVRIDFDSKPLIDYLADYDRQMLALESSLKGKRVLSLTYEQDIEENPLKAYSQICDFIGVKTTNVSVKLAKTNPFPVRTMVENFEELKETLCGTPYEWMLES